MSRVLHLRSWVKRLQRWCPIAAISQELVRFDTAALQTPGIQGEEYQRGTLFEAEVKEYLLAKWQHRCAYCLATDTRLEIDHVHPRSKGGSDRVSNLVIACRACNEAKADQPIEIFLADRPEVLARIQVQLKAPLVDAAAVNSTRWRLYEELGAIGLPVEVGTGGRTRWNRGRLALPKAHWLDAAAVGASTPDRLRTEHVRPWLIEARGRQARQMVNVDGHGFPRGKPKGPSRVRGFRTGDLVKAVVPPHLKARGVQRGRVLVRIRGIFDLQTRHGRVKDIPARYCQSLQQKDGYAYQQSASLPPHA
jgi:5-methylcytosine-specific restriction endonuclease McrA